MLIVRVVTKTQGAVPGSFRHTSTGVPTMEAGTQAVSSVAAPLRTTSVVDVAVEPAGRA